MRQKNKRNPHSQMPLLRVQNHTQRKTTNSKKNTNRLGENMILTTTSRKPSQNTRRLARTLANTTPHSHYSPRGKKNTEQLAQEARKYGYPRILIITEKHGNPHQIQTIQITQKNWQWEPTTITLKNTQTHKKPKPAKTLNITGPHTKPLTKILNTETSPEADTQIRTTHDTLTITQNNQKTLQTKITITEVNK